MNNIPVYNNENVALYHGDCFQVLEQIEPNSVDMIFADPPYFLSSGGIGCKSGKQTTVNKGDWDKLKTIEEKISYNCQLVSLCKKILKDNGTIWISGTFHNIYAIGVALELEGFSIINNITRQKPNPVPNLGCRCFTNSTETILWARKVLSKSKKGKHYFDYKLMNEYNGGKQMKDVWIFTPPKKDEKRFGKHPTQKPVELMKRIIEASTKENDVILDPFNGSGTSGAAATELNRRYIGIESNKDYIDITIKRIEQLKEGKK